MATRENAMFAELERRFDAVGVAVTPDRLQEIADVVAAVTAVGLCLMSALDSLDEMFPEVRALLRAERRERLRTGVDPAPWDPAELEQYGWRASPIDDDGPALVPYEVLTGLQAALPWCEGNLFDWKITTWFAREYGWHEAAEWIEDHVGEYLLGVYQGFDTE